MVGLGAIDLVVASALCMYYLPEACWYLHKLLRKSAVASDYAKQKLSIDQLVKHPSKLEECNPPRKRRVCPHRQTATLGNEKCKCAPRDSIHTTLMLESTLVMNQS